MEKERGEEIVSISHKVIKEARSRYDRVINESNSLTTKANALLVISGLVLTLYIGLYGDERIAELEGSQKTALLLFAISSITIIMLSVILILQIFIPHTRHNVVKLEYNKYNDEEIFNDYIKSIEVYRKENDSNKRNLKWGLGLFFVGLGSVLFENTMRIVFFIQD